MHKNPEDRTEKKIVLFVTEEQKARLQKYCSENGTTMSEWVRDKIDRLPK